MRIGNTLSSNFENLYLPLLLTGDLLTVINGCKRGLKFVWKSMGV